MKYLKTFESYSKDLLPKLQKIKDEKGFFTAGMYESLDKWDPKVVIPESLEDRCKMFIDKENKGRIESGDLKYTINGDFVDVDSPNISLKLHDMDKIPIKFGVVEGNMFITGDILTLENSPERVGTMNIIGCENLKSLVGGPEFVRNWYHLPVNLQSLEGLAMPWDEKYILSFQYDINARLPRYFTETKLPYVLELFINRRGHEFHITNEVYYDICLFNDYDSLHGDTLILDRMNQFLEARLPEGHPLSEDNIERLKSYGIKVI